MANPQLDRAGWIFQPQVILPTQFAEVSGNWPGERRLALAVLEEALTTLFRKVRVISAQADRQREEAQRWIDTDDDRWPFSFVNVCDTVGVDAGRLRVAILLAIATGKTFNTRQWKRANVGRDGGGGLNSDSPAVRRRIALLGVRARRVSQRQVRGR